MTTILFVLFWLAAALLIWVYALYPLTAWLYGRVRPVRLATAGPLASPVTIGLAVHDGAGDVAERIGNIAADAVPFEFDIVVVSDGSTDETAAIARRLAESDGRIRVIELPRRGQAAAQAAIFEAARGPVVVLTDVETRFTRGCLAALAAPFADPRVGCVTGVLHWHYDERTHTAQHEGLYWRYEQSVRAWESRAGWLAAGTGALLAIRRDLYRSAPAHASLDQLLPLYARQAGALVVVAPEGIGTDRGTASLGEQLANRTRIATQGIEANLRMSVHIPPWRRPGTFLGIWSHKIMRWATPWLGLVAIAAGIGLYASGRTPAYLLPAAGASLILGAALIGYAASRSGRHVPLTGFPLTLVAVNLAFARAWLNVLTRRRIRAWESPGHPLAD